MLDSSKLTRVDLIFSPKFDSQQNYLIKVPTSFLEDLNKQQQFVLQGSSDTHAIINSQKHSYLMKSVNLSTSVMLIDKCGKIYKQSDSYIELDVFQPEYHLIYQKLYERSCQELDKDKSYEQFIKQFSFTQQSFTKWTQISINSYHKFADKLDFVKQEPNSYVYLTLPYKISCLREIINLLNQERISLFQNLPYSYLLERLPWCGQALLDNLKNFYHCQKKTQDAQIFNLNSFSICMYIVGELAIAKSQYTQVQYHQILEEMIALYMPAQVDTQCEKLRQFLDQCRMEYFIEKKTGEGTGSLYIFYDYLQLDTNILNRLKYLAGFKKRFTNEELRMIFRGMQTCENGKTIPFTDVLLKKFRKLGEHYEIKFVLPK